MKTDVKTAWQTIFDQFKIIDAVKNRGHFDISADDIKRIGGKEPRIMAKWDSTQSVPDVFSKNSLGMISISRKGYRIAPFNLFHKIEAKELNAAKIQSLSIPTWLRSLSDDIRSRSEPGLLSSCYASGMMGEYAHASAAEIFPGIFGRLTTNKMDFSLRGIGWCDGKRIPLSCNKVQFEIDASYESPEMLLLVEAKNCLLEDFNIRQLYFPWRYLSTKIGKPIRPLFIMRSNEIISVLEYEFAKVDEMDSLKLVSANRYSFDDTNISIQDLQETLESVRQTKKARDSMIFPQANRMALIIDVCERLQNASAETDDIADSLHYVHRQGHYYAEAARFLGLVDRSGSSYVLTKDGKRIFNLPYKRRQLEVVKKILQYNVFAKSLGFALKNGRLPTTSQVASWVVEDNWQTSGTTPKRRASTVLSWIRWSIDLTKASC